MSIFVLLDENIIFIDFIRFLIIFVTKFFFSLPAYSKLKIGALNIKKKIAKNVSSNKFLCKIRPKIDLSF